MRTLYKNRTITVGEAIAKINGKSSKFLKIVENDIIVVLPVIGEEIIMERQYRPVIDKYIYELPAGHIEKGESKVGAVKEKCMKKQAMCQNAFRSYSKATHNQEQIQQCSISTLQKTFQKKKRSQKLMRI